MESFVAYFEGAEVFLAIISLIGLVLLVYFSCRDTE